MDYIKHSKPFYSEKSYTLYNFTQSYGIMDKTTRGGNGLEPIRGLQIPVTEDLICKFLEHVQSSPDAIAIMTTEETLSYEALYLQVMHWKTVFSPCIHDKTIVCLERSPRLVAVFIALQWMNIPYIPIDKSLPIKRIKTILEDSQAQAFLFDGVDRPDYSELSCTRLDLNQFKPQPAALKKEPVPNHRLEEQALAYIIYTSGSTGQPKGVAITRLALNNFLACMSRYFMNEDNAMLLAITTIAFDIAALELFLPIWQKKTVFLSNQQEHTDPLRLMEILNQYPISHMQATPSMWKLLTQMPPPPSSWVALCGGEPLNSELAKTLLSMGAQLWNLYGPTEATIWCALKQICPGEPITIGRPVDNTEMCVMDSSFNILPPYVKGGLYISGLCLAQGYVNKPALTQERFIPWKKALGGFLYQVGDIACSTAEGEFIVFGRSDNQVKLHGYRIELEGIEAQIQRMPGIREVAVQVHNEQLLAYLCLSDPKQAFSEAEFRAELAAELPEYMIPNRILLLDKLPTSTSGKIHRQSLPKPSVTSQEDALVHLSSTEATLISIWASELGVLTLGIDDNFFELGGHSLIAARIVLQSSLVFGKQMQVHDLYRAPTIAEYSALLAQAKKREQKTTTYSSKTWQPLDDFQLTLWMSRFFEPQIKKINIAARRRLQGQINKKALDLALQLVLQKQEVLTYRINRFYPAQKPQQLDELHWVETSLRDLDEQGVETHLSLSFDELFHHRFWGDNTLMRARLFYLPKERVELQVSFSHFISDEESIEIFFQELTNTYHFYTDYLVLNAKEPSHCFLRYVEQKNALAAKCLCSDASFWQSYLEDADYCYFPAQCIHQDKSLEEGLSTYMPLSEGLLGKLRKFCLKNQLTLNEVLCAAVAYSLKKVGADTKIKGAQLFMNTVKSARDDPNYDQVMGCFLYLQSFKVNWEGAPSLLHLAKQIRDSMLETMEYQRAPNFIKFSYVGTKSKLQKGFISCFSVLFSRLSYWFNLHPMLITACIALIFRKNNKSFLVNVNVFNSFLRKHKQKSEPSLLNLPLQPIPTHHYPILPIHNVFDVCFYRHWDRPMVAVTSNLSAVFRQTFGNTLLKTLDELEK